MWRYWEGFRAGANYIDETVEVLVVYRDDGSREQLFIDPDWGFENAQNLMQDGVDIIFAAGGETAVGALRATEEAKVRAIGAERDQSAALENQGSGVITSVLGHASFTVRELMRNIKAGKLQDVEAGPIQYVSLEQVVPISLVAEMKEILSGLRSGELKTNVPNEKP
jgi:basic membrane protein A